MLSQRGSLKKLGDIIYDPDFSRCVLALRLVLLLWLLRAQSANVAPALRLRLKDGIRIQLNKTILETFPALRAGLYRERQ